MSNRRDFLRKNFESVNLTGNIGVDGGTPAVSLDLGNRTDSIILPKGTTAQRPSPNTAGMLRYNTELDQYELYDETLTTWGKLGDQPPTISSISPATTETVTGTTEFTVLGNGFESTGMTTQLVSTIDNTVVNRTAFAFDNSGQIRITFDNTDFDAAKEPYNLVITKTSGLSVTKLNALYVDEAPVWTLTNTNVATILPQAFTNVNIDLPTATDPEGDTVTYSASNLPNGLSIDANTGDLSGGVPAANTEIEYTVTVNALSTGSDPGATQKTTTRQPTIIVKPVIENSLMFDGSSYLQKTNLGSVTAANGYTLSLWAKIIPHSGGGYFFSVSSNHGLAHQPDSSNAGLIQYWNGSTQFDTPNKLRDYSSWYHIVFSAVSGSHARLYINGDTVVDNNSISVNNFGGSSVTNRIGAWHNNATSYNFTGYLADIYFIDGQALTPQSFGETINGIWLPKVYNPTGTPLTDYGTNGFHLTFAPSTISGTTVQDVSGRNNHWTANGF